MMTGCNKSRIAALARSVFGVSPVLAVATFPAASLAQSADSILPVSFVWVEIFSALILLFSGVAVWIIAHNQTKRIRASDFVRCRARPGGGCRGRSGSRRWLQRCCR